MSFVVFVLFVCFSAFGAARSSALFCFVFVSHVNNFSPVYVDYQPFFHD